MKTSFASFWRKIIGAARLSVISQLEYRFNLFTDVLLQPAITSLVEVALWAGIFGAVGAPTLAGFPRESYLAYALWAPFFARIAANWMYEFRMTEEIESGSVNAVLSRPVSFYEFYLGQFLGYKLMTSALSILPAAVAFAAFGVPAHYDRLPLALALSFFYVLLAHTMSFIVASCGFYFTNVHSLTVAKNIALWMLTGELFPVDMAPEPYRSWLLALPFSSAVYRPVGFLVGRIDGAEMANGFLSVAIGLAVVSAVAYGVWSGGRRRYSGTGA